jgi:hypothetical protein
MDILNWLYIKKQQLIRTTIDSPQDLVVLGADVSFQKRGDKYQSYAIPAEDFLAPVARPYKVYTALLTQSGGDDPIELTSGDLTIGVTYFIQLLEGADFSNVGGSNVEGTYFIATGTTPNSWGIGGQLEGNTGAPVVTVLENTIGNIWFTYNVEGSYYLNSNGLFTVGKSWAPTITIFNDSALTQDGEILRISDNLDGSIFSLSSCDQDGVQINSKFNNTPIEIRVYN